MREVVEVKRGQVLHLLGLVPCCAAGEKVACQLSWVLQKGRDMQQLGLPIGPSECRFYEGCTAPLCPLNTNLGRSTWYPGEPVCHLKEAPDWVRKQRRIARLQGIDQSRCFTIHMLDSLAQVHKGLQGIVPDDPGEEKAWLKQQGKARVRRRTGKKKSDQPRLSAEFWART